MGGGAYEGRGTLHNRNAYRVVATCKRMRLKKTGTGLLSKDRPHGCYLHSLSIAFPPLFCKLVIAERSQMCRFCPMCTYRLSVELTSCRRLISLHWLEVVVVFTPDAELQRGSIFIAVFCSHPGDTGRTTSICLRRALSRPLQTSVARRPKNGTSWRCGAGWATVSPHAT